METKIIYTESGKNAIEKYLEEQKKQLEKKIYDEKYIFGDNEIEITASDIDLYTKQELFEKRKNERKKRISFILEMYIFLGIIMVIFGLCYPIFLEMIEINPTQFILTMAGSMLVIVGGLVWLYLNRRNKK